VVLSGCQDNQALPYESERGVQPSSVASEIPEVMTLPDESTPYPLAVEAVATVSPLPTNEPYPVTGEPTLAESTSDLGLQTPTAHVDVVMRATNPQDFVLASGRYQLVEFFAFWCPTCKSMLPVLRNLENKYAGKVQFIYLDIDDPRTNPLKQALGYQYQPHLFLLNGEGKVIKQWIGYVPEVELDTVLSSLQ